MPHLFVSQSIKFLTYCAAVMDALLESGAQFADVGVLTTFLMVIFGIMGVQVLLQFCSAPECVGVCSYLSVL